MGGYCSCVCECMRVFVRHLGVDLFETKKADKNRPKKDGTALKLETQVGTLKHLKVHKDNLRCEQTHEMGS